MKKKGEVYQALKKKAKRARYTSWILFGASVTLFLTAQVDQLLRLNGFILLGLAFIATLFSVKLNRRLLKGDLED